ncbi:MAG: GGDEF domain-containing protein [Actinomycetota bacterium]
MISLSASWWSGDLANAVAWHSFGAVAVATMCWGIARRPSGDRLGYALIAIGLAAWVLGDVVWDWLSWASPLPDVSAVDALYILGYLSFIAGLVVLTRNATGEVPTDVVIDGAVLAAAAGVVFWVGLIEPAREAGDLLYRSITTAYPLLAILLLAALVWMVLHPDRRSMPAGSRLIGAAIVILLVLEPVSAWYYLHEPSIDLEPTIDRSFQVAYALIALAPFRTRTLRRPSDRHTLHPLRLVMIGSALVAGPVTMFLVEGSRAPALIASSIISGLVLIRFVTLSRDRERAQAELAHRATHDALTGLANREVLEAAYAEPSAAGGDDDSSIALFYLDVDGFKSVNDTFGHAVGDAVLVELADRIRAWCRRHDVAIRLGGDEFVVLCESITDIAQAGSIARQLQDRIAPDFELDELAIDVSLSIGVATTARRGRPPIDVLLRQADMALYQAKHRGRGLTVVSDDSVDRLTHGNTHEPRVAPRR